MTAALRNRIAKLEAGAVRFEPLYVRIRSFAGKPDRVIRIGSSSAICSAKPLTDTDGAARACTVPPLTQQKDAE